MTDPPEYLAIEDAYVSPTLKVVRIVQDGELPWFQFLLLVADDPRPGLRWRTPDPIE